MRVEDDLYPEYDLEQLLQGGVKGKYRAMQNPGRGVYTYLDDLKGKKYQIPTFQREIVWEKEHVKKLWDSIYRFYPLGSILLWKTDVKRNAA
jgi:uncharacterized protein with ParB-like and HNH nuclease domain